MHHQETEVQRDDLHQDDRQEGVVDQADDDPGQHHVSALVDQEVELLYAELALVLLEDQAELLNVLLPDPEDPRQVQLREAAEPSTRPFIGHAQDIIEVLLFLEQFHVTDELLLAGPHRLDGPVHPVDLDDIEYQLQEERVEHQDRHRAVVVDQPAVVQEGRVVDVYQGREDEVTEGRKVKGQDERIHEHLVRHHNDDQPHEVQDGPVDFFVDLEAFLNQSF